MSRLWNAEMEDALRTPRDVTAGHVSRPEIYGTHDDLLIKKGFWAYKDAFKDGYQTDDGKAPWTEFRNSACSRKKSKEQEIAYTFMTCEDKLNIRSDDIVLVFLHGVPTSSRQWYPVQEKLAHFYHTLSFDFLGMGESSKPIFVKREARKWRYDAVYIQKMLSELPETRDKRITLVGDDWGSAPMMQVASNMSASNVEYAKFTVNGVIIVDPIFVDHPVKEIQTIGEASKLEYDPKNPNSPFHVQMRGFGSSLIRTLETMVDDPGRVMTRYTRRDYLWPFYFMEIESDDQKYDTLNIPENMWAIRSLSERAAILGPYLVLPKTPTNSEGIDYSRIKCDVTVFWGDRDKMMPQKQMWLYKYVCKNTDVSCEKIANAGHFSGVDQPAEMAEKIHNRMTYVYGVESSRAFEGFTGIWLGNEKEQMERINEALENARV